MWLNSVCCPYNLKVIVDKHTNNKTKYFIEFNLCVKIINIDKKARMQGQENSKPALLLSTTETSG
jgi:hypothetical protein